MTAWPGRSVRRTALRTAAWLAFASLPAALIMAGGATLGAYVADRAPPATLHTWADLGQAFGALSAIAAVAALGAFVFTFAAQQRESRENRRELQMQRQALARSERELHCAAETGLSMFHFKLLALSIDNPDLAAVWPSAEPHLPHEVNQRYLYCTLILEGVWLNARAGRFNDDDIRAAVTYLFTSPVFRKYWQAFRSKRGLAAASDGPESRYFRMVDEVYAACDPVTTQGRPEPHASSSLRPRQ
jgi:hypothetical protein